MKSRVVSILIILIAAVLLIPDDVFAGGNKLASPRDLYYFPVANEHGTWPFNNINPPEQLWFILEDANGVLLDVNHDVGLDVEWDTASLNELAEKFNCQEKRRTLGLGAFEINGRLKNEAHGYELADGFEIKMIIDIRDETAPCIIGAQLTRGLIRLTTVLYPFMFDHTDPEYSDFILWYSNDYCIEDKKGTWVDVTDRIAGRTTTDLQLLPGDFTYPASFRLEHKNKYSNIFIFSNSAGELLTAIGGDPAPAPPPSNNHWSLSGREIIGTNRFLYIPLSQGQDPWKNQAFLAAYNGLSDSGLNGEIYLAPNEWRVHPLRMNMAFWWDTEAFYTVDTSETGVIYTIPLTALRRRQIPNTMYKPEDFTNDFSLDIIVEIVPPDMPRIFGTRSFNASNGFSRSLHLQMHDTTADGAGFNFNPLYDSFVLWASNGSDGEWESVSVTYNPLAGGGYERIIKSDPDNRIITKDNIGIRNTLIEYFYNDLSEPLFFIVEVNGVMSNTARVFDLIVGIEIDGQPIVHTFNDLRDRWGHDRDGIDDLPGIIPKPDFSLINPDPAPVTVSADDSTQSNNLSPGPPVTVPSPSPDTEASPSPEAAAQSQTQAHTVAHEAIINAAIPGSGGTLAVPENTPAYGENVQIIANYSTGEVTLVLNDETIQGLIEGALLRAAEENEDGILSIPTVVLDITGVENAVSAVLDAGAVSAFTASGAAVTLKFPGAHITLPPEALLILSEAGGEVNVKASAVNPNSLNPEQAAQLNGHGTIISINVYAGETKLNVPLSVSIPYTHNPNEDPAFLTVWHLDDYGVLTVKSSEYNITEGIVTFTVNHQSYFVIGYYTGFYPIDSPPDISIMRDNIEIRQNPFAFPTAAFIFLGFGIAAVGISFYIKVRGIGNAER